MTWMELKEPPRDLGDFIERRKKHPRTNRVESKGSVENENFEHKGHQFRCEYHTKS